MSKAGIGTSAVLLLGTAIAVVLALAVLPMHVTFGAGSLRCGTVIQPDTSSEIADVCPEARAEHLRAAIVTGAVLAVVSLFPLLSSVITGDRASRFWLVTSITVWILCAMLALLWIGSSVEYSPPADIFEL